MKRAWIWVALGLIATILVPLPSSGAVEPSAPELHPMWGFEGVEYQAVVEDQDCIRVRRTGQGYLEADQGCVDAIRSGYETFALSLGRELPLTPANVSNNCSLSNISGEAVYPPSGDTFTTLSFVQTGCTTLAAVPLMPVPENWGDNFGPAFKVIERDNGLILLDTIPLNNCSDVFHWLISEGDGKKADGSIVLTMTLRAGQDGQCVLGEIIRRRVSIRLGFVDPDAPLPQPSSEWRFERDDLRIVDEERDRACVRVRPDEGFVVDQECADSYGDGFQGFQITLGDALAPPPAHLSNTCGTIHSIWAQVREWSNDEWEPALSVFADCRLIAVSLNSDITFFGTVPGGGTPPTAHGGTGAPDNGIYMNTFDGYMPGCQDAHWLLAHENGDFARLATVITVINKRTIGRGCQPAETIRRRATIQLGYLTPQTAQPAIHMLDDACFVAVPGGQIAAGQTVDLAIGTECSLPDHATAATVSIWATDPLREGNLRLGPSGGAVSGVVNFGANGLENTTSLTVPVSVDGELALEVNGGAAAPGAVLAGSATIEVLAWIGPDPDPGLLFHPTNPCVFFDSRENQGSANPGPLIVGTGIDADVVGVFPAGQGGGQTDCGVPDTAAAALVNFVLIQPDGETRLMARSSGATLVFNEPLSAPFNNASAVMVPIDAGGVVSVDLEGAVGAGVQVRMQVLGYYAPPAVAGGLVFVPLDPCVVFDSRSNQGAIGGFAGARLGGSTTTYDVVGGFDPGQGGGNSDCGVPVEAEAVELNFVGVNAIREGNLKVSAAGVEASGGVLNFGALVPKMNNANAAVVPVSASGGIDVFMNGGPQGAGLPVAEVRGTITGYYAPA